MGSYEAVLASNLVLLNRLRHVTEGVHGVGVAADVGRFARPNVRLLVPLVLQFIEAGDDALEPLVDF